MKENAAVFALLFALLNSSGRSAESPYPNELAGFKFYEVAKWRVLKPLVSTDEDVQLALGSRSTAYYDAGLDWMLEVSILGRGGSCDGRPFPESLVGKVTSIALLPKKRLSFAATQFSEAFARYEVFSAHDPVGQWDVFEDAYGLRYEIYTATSNDKKIRAGDLKAIVYGPPKQLLGLLTGCGEVRWP